MPVQSTVLNKPEDSPEVVFENMIVGEMYIVTKSCNSDFVGSIVFRGGNKTNPHKDITILKNNISSSRVCEPLTNGGNTHTNRYRKAPVGTKVELVQR